MSNSTSETNECGHTEAEHREMFGDAYIGNGIAFTHESAQVFADDDRTKEFISSVNLANLSLAFVSQNDQWPSFREYAQKNGQGVLKFEDPRFTPRVLQAAANHLSEQVRAFASAAAVAKSLGKELSGLIEQVSKSRDPHEFLTEKGTTRGEN